jgi:hypothetical protein
MVSLGGQRVRGHDRATQVQVVQQRAELGDLVGGVVDFALREDRALTVEHRGEQLHLSAVGASGAAQRLAVDRDRRQLLVTAVGGGWVGLLG